MTNPVRVIKDTEYPRMYRLQWKDGTLSEDMYNLTRANDILKNYKSYRACMFKKPPSGPKTVTGEF